MPTRWPPRSPAAPPVGPSDYSGWASSASTRNASPLSIVRSAGPSSTRTPASCGGHAVGFGLQVLADRESYIVREAIAADSIVIRGDPANHGYGIATMMQLPGGLEVRLHQPLRSTAI
jgi:hypothetical protein